MNEWNAMTYEGKDTILRVVREQAESLISLASAPESWDAPTACEGWAPRDVVGHLVDTIESYFQSFDAAREGADATPFGLAGMAKHADAGAKSFRDESQGEMIARLRKDLDQLMGILEQLSAEDWSGLMAPHFYMGPVPAFFFAAGQLMDYAVHSWDIRQGTGLAHGIDGDVADLLVPFMFVLWQSTIQADADKSPFEIGIRVGGRNGGDFRVGVGPDGMAYEQGSIDDLPAIIEFDAGTMVLTAFGRVNGGTIRGDRQLAERFLNLFFRI
jgi:uncharacterized protein (TIGR03083 family)